MKLHTALFKFIKTIQNQSHSVVNSHDLNGHMYIVRGLKPGFYTFDEVLALADEGQVTITRLQG